MKSAVFSGTVVTASSDAPPHALCPNCGERVELRCRREQWYYRHRPALTTDCSLRVRPARDMSQSGLVGDPHIVMALHSARQAAWLARRGDLEAILSMAFSPILAQLFEMAGMSPEDALDLVSPRKSRAQPRVVLAEDDELGVLRMLRTSPGPIFDLRPSPDGHHAELERSGWYVPVYSALSEARLVRRVVGLADVVYVLGSETEWKRILALGSC